MGAGDAPLLGTHGAVLLEELVLQHIGLRRREGNRIEMDAALIMVFRRAIGQDSAALFLQKRDSHALLGVVHTRGPQSSSKSQDHLPRILWNRPDLFLILPRVISGVKAGLDNGGGGASHLVGEEPIEVVDIESARAVPREGPLYFGGEERDIFAVLPRGLGAHRADDSTERGHEPDEQEEPTQQDEEASEGDKSHESEAEEP